MTRSHLIGYVSIKNLPIFKEEDIKKLEIINLAFAQIEEGKVISDIEDYLSYIEKAKKINPQIRFVLSIGGWGAGGFSKAASTKKGREVLIQSAIEHMIEAKLDGIDLDWEYPCIGIAGIDAAKEDKENFTYLMKEFRYALDEQGHEDALLTIAVAGDGYYTRCTEMDQVQKYVDYIQLMTYDLRGGFTIQTGHHANLYSNAADFSSASADQAVKYYVEAGVPKEKLVLGAAFYSRMWKGVPNVNQGWMQMAETTGGYGPDYNELQAHYIDKNGFTRFWDDEAKAPYLFNGDCFISYEDQESLFYKLNYIQDEGLYGLMYWEYGTDISGTLLEFIHGERIKENETVCHVTAI